LDEIVRCERSDNADVVAKISQTLGAIGYADAASIADARRNNLVTALIIDNKVFDTNTVVRAATRSGRSGTCTRCDADPTHPARQLHRLAPVSLCNYR
jgi:ABC-type phosphate transport system substrate-binding protein